MVELLVGAGTLAFRKALQVLNKKLACGDITEQQFRSILITDLDEIKESLNTLRHKEFQAAALQLSNAFDLYKLGKCAEAEFIKARGNAEMSLGALRSIPDKIEAVRMAALAAVYQHGADKETAMTFCLGYLRHLLAMPEIQATFRVRRSSNLASRLKRKVKKAVKVIDDVVTDVNAFAWDMACYMQEEGRGVRWPCLMSGPYYVHPLIPPDNDDPCSGDKNSAPPPTAFTKYRFESSEKHNSIRVFKAETGKLFRQLQSEAFAMVVSTGGFVVSFKLEKQKDKTKEKPKEKVKGKDKDKKSKVMVINYMEVRNAESLALVATLDFAPDTAVCGEVHACARGDKLVVGVSGLVGLWDVGRGARGKCHWVVTLPGEAGGVTGVSWCCDRHIEVRVAREDGVITLWAD